MMGSSKDRLDPLRKAIPKDKIGIDLRIPSEDEIKGGLSKIEGLLPKYQALWRVCLDSGIRLIEAIHLINDFDPQRLQAVNGFYRYQTGEFRGTKQSYFAYFTESSLRLIQDANGGELHRPDTSGYYSRHGLTQPKYLRKFAFDKMIELEIPESVADFIQGRVAMRVGAKHYMSLARQVDKLYSKYAGYLASLNGEVIQHGSDQPCPSATSSGPQGNIWDPRVGFARGQIFALPGEMKQRTISTRRSWIGSLSQ